MTALFVAVAPAAHAAGDAVCLEAPLVVLAGVDRAWVGVMEQARRPESARHGGEATHTRMDVEVLLVTQCEPCERRVFEKRASISPICSMT
jgi:hypothetical protein